MTVFASRNVSTSTVPARPGEIWQLITNPSTLAELTPLVRSIEASGSRWEWTLNGIDALGVNVEAVFTERMEFFEERKIVFSHDPPSGKQELAGLEGIYELTPAGPGATDLKVDLTLSVEIPLPRLSKPVVEGVIGSIMRTTGKSFASNLYERLGLDPSTVAITELPIR